MSDAKVTFLLLAYNQERRVISKSCSMEARR